MTEKPASPEEKPDDAPDLLSLDDQRRSLLSVFMADALVFAVAFGTAWLIIYSGHVFGAVFRLSNERWGIVTVLSVFVYLYLKYTTRLRLEIRRLQALEALLKAFAKDQKKDAAKDRS